MKLFKKRSTTPLPPLIEGGDWSHWNGLVDCTKFRAKGGRFTGIKVSQGVDYKDDKAEANNAAARAAGILTFPYHFVTTDPPAAQYDWFIKCIGSMKFDLAPGLDYEYYNQVSREPYLAMREADFRFPYGATSLGVGLWARSLGLVLPSAATLYTMANRLRGWNNHPVPAIYANPSTANAKLVNSGSTNWSQFLLWIANWNVAAPVIPTAWKGQSYYIWQDRVIRNAQDWGVDGDMDHDLWGDKLPFPSEPPPPQDEFSLRLYIHELDKLIEVNDAN